MVSFVNYLFILWAVRNYLFGNEASNERKSLESDNNVENFWIVHCFLLVWLLVFYNVGYVCDSLSVDSESRCCPELGDKFSCQWVFS